MSIRLKELERRSYQRSLSARGLQRSVRHASFTAPRQTALPKAPSSRRIAGRAFGGSALETKLAAAGVEASKAAEIAAAIAAFDSSQNQSVAASAMSTRMPTTEELSGLAKNAALYALSAATFGPMGPLGVEAIFAACTEFDLCIAFGVGAVGGFIAGLGASGGLVFAPGRRLGVYGSLGGVLGEIMDISVGVQVTVVSGGLSNFNGRSYTIGGALGEGLGVSGHFILGSNGMPIGLMGELDIRGGAPIRGIIGAWETRSVTTQFTRPAPSNSLSHARRDIQDARLSVAYNRDEASFNTLAGAPVHYDRLDPPNGYGSTGQQRTLRCTNELQTALENCMTDLFAEWNEGTPSIILTAGTLGDGENAHGQGNAFDLDGFYWGNRSFMMNQYPANRRLYNGINAHLFLYFPQVLSYHYPGHADHFHVDFNSASRNYYRTGSNAQTFFVQSCLKYLYGQNLGTSGPENDGVDGDYGPTTQTAIDAVLPMIDMTGKSITTSAADWREFLTKMRANAFHGNPSEQAPLPGQAVPLPR